MSLLRAVRLRSIPVRACPHAIPSAIAALMLAACGGPQSPPAASPSATAPSAETGTAFKAAMILVGPQNDGGWNQAHVEGSKYVMEKMPGVTFDYVDKVNPADRPNVKGAQVADDLIAQGAKVVIFNSEDFKDDALATAKKHPDVAVIHASGDYAWKAGKNFKNQKNLGNVMGQVEYMKALSGCTAALHTETGKIGYLGPLINEETRRLATSAFLGAKHCWEKYRQKPATDLTFKVTWIGFWFNIPGTTLDPTKVADDFYNGGFDVVLSGIDTPEVAVQAKKAAAAGKKVRFVHYDLKTGCDLAPDICLGVPYYNWGPLYAKEIEKAKQGNYQGEFVWATPNWKDLNNPDTSPVGFVKGKAMLPEASKQLDEFVAVLADGSVTLFAGPLQFQDGTDFLKAGEVATPQQLWYLPKLLKGMEGASE